MEQNRLSEDSKSNIAAAFQISAVSQIKSRLIKALKHPIASGLNAIVIGGGVASNQAVQSCIQAVAAEYNLKVHHYY
jgi:tRNA A37 threonylcarbamoyltransferase TsaD